LITEEMLLQYKEYFMSKPGRCKDFEYEFKVTSKETLAGHSSSTPLLEDNITKVSSSGHINPLTIVLRECKSPRIVVVRDTTQLAAGWYNYRPLATCTWLTKYWFFGISVCLG
jgi:hypothetical protein